MPPVARTTARACTAPTPPRVPSPRTCRVTPATAGGSSAGPSAGIRSRTRACWMISMPSSAVTAAISALSISAPVASPPAWAIRLRWCPPSRVRASAPAASRSNSAPRAISLATSSGPSLTSTRTAASMHSPAPATRVSSMCCCTVSPSAWTEAMPPCAQCVDPADSWSLVTTTTRPRVRHSSAAVRPAMPEPTTTTSTSVTQPGGSAASRCGSRGKEGRRRREVASWAKGSAPRAPVCPCARGGGPRGSSPLLVNPRVPVCPCARGGGPRGSSPLLVNPRAPVCPCARGGGPRGSSPLLVNPRAPVCPGARGGGARGSSPLLVNRDATSGTMVDMLPHQPLEAPNARSWFDAWLESAYGADGFWRRHWPDEHFRTAAATSPMFAEAVAAVASRIGVDAVVDVGSGRGDLLTGLAGSAAALRLAGIDLRSRPEGLPATVDWAEDLWDVRYGRWTTGQAEALLGGDGPVLVVAAEWLDDLPAHVVTLAADGWRDVVVEPGGEERPGPRLTGADLEWADRWWPSGQRAEIGSTRDRAWAALASVVRRRGGGLLLVDYGHDREHRPAEGSFTAYRDGRQVPPMPSTEMNLTAHVSVDAVRTAGEAAGLRTVLDALQDEALARLLAAGQPDADPLRDLARRSERAALASAYGWGTHRWLVQLA